MTSREMIVYRKDGSVYFRTSANWSPGYEAREADFWIRQGFVVKFEEVPIVEPS